MTKTLADMTPEQARELLDGATPGPWKVLFDNEAIETDTSTVLYNTDGAVEWGRNIEHDVPLAAAAPELAQTIAGMTYEYAVQVRIQENGHWHRVTEWNPDPNPYKPGNALKHNERLVRRLVSQPEEVQP